MKKNIIILFLFSYLSLSSQNNQQDLTYVIYKFKNVMVDSTKFARFNPNLLEFEFIYENKRSLFKIIDKMESHSKQDYKITSIIYGGNLIHFRDNSIPEKLFNVNYKGQSLNVIIDLKDSEWQISNESKYIGKFKCYKAITVIKKEDKGRNTVKILNPIVWFTPDLPTSFGPFGLDGLPGLIIEGTIDGKAYFYADKVSLKADKKFQIEKPGKAIKITEIDFDGMIATDFINSREK